MMWISSHEANGPLLTAGQLGFFVEVILFCWIAELIFFSHYKSSGHTSNQLRFMRLFFLPLIPALVSIGFLAYHILAGESLNWPAVLISMMLGLPMAYAITRLLPSVWDGARRRARHRT
jgi:hypothetical protein